MHAKRTRGTLLAASGAIVALAATVPIATAGDGDRGAAGPDRAVIKAAIKRHLANVENCDAQGLVDDYTADARVFFPDGGGVSGRAEITALYENFVKPRDQGGLCGLRLKVVDRFLEGRSAIVKVRVTADFLAEPYISTDGYVFRGGRISGEVSTLDSTKLKFK